MKKTINKHKSIYKTQIVYAALLCTAAAARADTPPAFPGAEGFGAKAIGGRGAPVYRVTNLTDAGPGSFRDAVSKGPRTILFAVAGYIDLKSPVHIASDLTIAGESAPGQGVSTKNYEISFSDSHNVIVRYLRFRQGLTKGQEKKYVVGLDTSKDMIFDHVSLEWGRWDIIGMNKSENITMQYCLIGEGIDPQRFGCLCQSDNVTFSHNLWMNNQSRNPKGKGKIQYINNVVYNWGVAGYAGGHSGADHEADLVNNLFIKGPDSGAHFLGEFTDTDKLFQSGNVADLDLDGQLNPRPVTEADFRDSKGAPTFVSAAHLQPPVPVTVDSPTDAYQKIIAGAGCSRQRDAMDTRLINQVKSLGKSGKIIHDPQEVNGFGDIPAASAEIPTDSDHDGIPDDWETAHHLNPHDPVDAQSLSPEGYTMLELYLHSQAAK